MIQIQMKVMGGAGEKREECRRGRLHEPKERKKVSDYLRINQGPDPDHLNPLSDSDIPPPPAKSINLVTRFIAFELCTHPSSLSSSSSLAFACRSHSILPSTSQYSSRRMRHGVCPGYSQVRCSGWYRSPACETAQGPSMGCPHRAAAQRDSFASW